MKRTWNSRSIGMAALCCGLGLVMTDLSFAQQPATQQLQQQQLQQRQQQLQQRQQAQRQTSQKEFCLASDVIGMHVKAKGDEQVGEIKNLLINEQGQVKYLAVKTSHATTAATDRDRPATEARETPPAEILQQREQQRTGDATADSGKLTLVPWELAKMHEGESAAQSYVMIDIEKERLTSAPSFTEQQLTARTGQMQLTAQVDQFFNVRSQRGAARPQLDTDRPQQRQQPDRPQGINTPRDDDN